MGLLNQNLATACILTLLFGLIAQKTCIALAHRFKWLDVPSLRRRHKTATPIIGGVGVLSTFIFGMLSYGFLEDWVVMSSQIQTMSVLGVSIVVLLVLGLIDDLQGLAPVWKLLVEFAVAVFVVKYEPNIHSICLIWKDTLGIFVWPMALIWIVGITNAINLIDGLDGLAAGTSILVLSSISILSIWSGTNAYAATLITLLLLPSIMPFFKYNWSPAKIFLGDNGSLPLGFSIATTALMCRPQSRSWIMVASVVLMLGYPMLDMGLAVMRRHFHGLPLFKADRNHLHYRVTRLGFTVGQTCMLLLSITLYLQIASLSVNLMSQAAATVAISVVAFSIFTLLATVRVHEITLVKRLSRRTTDRSSHLTVGRLALHIELETFFESRINEENKKISTYVLALELLLKTLCRPEDRVFSERGRITVVFSERSDDVDTESKARIRERFGTAISQFLELYSLQCSLATIPMFFATVDIQNLGNSLVIVSPTADIKSAA